MITDNFEEEEITGINITPLVDVMLVLLIIFMVTTSYIVHRSIVVNLPKATTGENVITTKNLAFVLDKNSILYLDGKKIIQRFVHCLTSKRYSKDRIIFIISLHF